MPDLYLWMVCIGDEIGVEIRDESFFRSCFKSHISKKLLHRRMKYPENVPNAILFPRPFKRIPRRDAVRFSNLGGQVVM